MQNLSEYLRDKSDQQLEIISALNLINKEGIGRFPATIVAEKISSTTQKMGGAWTSLTKNTKSMPALVLRAGKKMIKKTNGQRKYSPLWVINKGVDWGSMEEELKKYSWIK